MNSAYDVPSGHAKPSVRAMRRNVPTSRSVKGGIVRSSPTPASSIRVAARCPVSSEICAFHASAGMGASYTSS